MCGIVSFVSSRYHVSGLGVGVPNMLRFGVCGGNIACNYCELGDRAYPSQAVPDGPHVVCEEARGKLYPEVPRCTSIPAPRRGGDCAGVFRQKVGGPWLAQVKQPWDHSTADSPGGIAA